MMRLIDADLMIESMGLENAVKYGNKDYEQHITSYGVLMRYEIKDEIDAQPTVEAVPLDALCEWLGEQGMLAPCYFDQKCDGCKLKAYWRQKKSECWKQCLTNWMEGQHE